MPRLAPLLLPLAAGALGYAAGRGWWPALQVHRAGPFWYAGFHCAGVPGCAAAYTPWAALAEALRDWWRWWRWTRRAACHTD